MTWVGYNMGMPFPEEFTKLREFKTLEEFVSALQLFKSWFGIEAELRTENDKIIASLPLDTNFDNFWLRPTQHDQFFILTSNIDGYTI